MSQAEILTHALTELQTALRRAAADYDWPRVIELSTQLLASAGCSPEDAIGALNQKARAEANLLNYEEAFKDLETAVLRAEAAALPVLHVKTLNLRAYLETIYLTDAEAGLQTARSAWTIAQRLDQNDLLAESTMVLSWAYYLLGDIDQLQEQGQRALSLAQESSNSNAEAGSYLALALAASRREQQHHASALFQKALSIYQRIGNRIDQIVVYVLIGFEAGDLAAGRFHIEHALQLARESNTLAHRLVLTNNLAFSLAGFGLYHQAQQLIEEVIQFLRSYDLPVGHYHSCLGTLIECCLPLGQYERIPGLLAEMQRAGDDLDGEKTAYISLLAGLTALQRGDPAEAVDHLLAVVYEYESADFSATTLAWMYATALAWLGMAELAMGDKTAAHEHTLQAVALQGRTFYAPQEIWWCHYRVARSLLQPSDQVEIVPLADDLFEILNRACMLMLDYLGNISDEGLRRNYLNKVPVNRDIAQEWTRRAAARGESLAPLTKRETSSAGFEEQFQRLVAIGNRLTAERDPETLPETIRNEFVELSGAERAIVALQGADGRLIWAATLGTASAERDETTSFVTPFVNEARDLRQPLLRDSEGSVPPGGIPELHLRSVIALPLLSQGKLWGVLYGDMRHIFGRFTEQDLSLLNLLANQAAAALENADWVRGLEQKVEERTAELQTANASLEERNAELAIINSIQEGLVAQTDMQGIYDLVGDKLAEIFPNAQSLLIATLDVETKTRHFVYLLEKGQRHYFEPEYYAGKPFEKFLVWQGGSREALVINENMAEIGPQIGITTIADTVPSKSMVALPLFIGSELKGAISIQDTEREFAFSEGDVRLLTTITNAMSVALESARLFEAEQQRVAELQIINGVQEGLVAQMDIQGIYDLVGHKIVEIFPNAQSVGILTVDAQEKILHRVFHVEKGKRHTFEPVSYAGQSYEGWFQMRIQTKETILVNEDMETYSREHGLIVLEDTDPPKSMVAVPMIVGDQVKGFVDLQDMERGHAFAEEDVRLLTTITNAMSVALENARLFDETQRLLEVTEQRAKELATINSVQEAMVSKLDMQAIYDLVGLRIQNIFDASVVTISVYDYAEEINRIVFAYEAGEHIQEHFEFPFTLIDKELMLTHKPIMAAEDMASFGKKYEIGIIPGTQPARSILIVPFGSGDKLEGCFSLQDISREHAYAERDVHLLQTLAGSMGIALNSARLFDETQRLLSETEARNAELSAISTVSQALVVETELENLIQLIGDQMRDIFQADIVYLALLDRQTKLITFPYQYGEEFTTLPLGEGLTSKIIETGEPLLINRDIDKRRAAMGATRVGIGSRSFLGVPIKVGQESIGVLSVQSTQREDYFDKTALNLLTTIAANAGAALENARLYREAQESKQMADEANAAKSAFLANMSHELRTPLNAIIGFTRIVKRKAQGNLPAQQIDNLGKVQSSAEHLLGLINTILDLAKIEAGRVDVLPAEFDIAPLVEICLTTAQPLVRTGVRMTADIPPDLPRAYSDQDKIKQILLNLLSNAAKFTHEGKIVVTGELRAAGNESQLAARSTNSQLLIEVRDTGIGMNEEQLGRVFEEFQQADATTTRQYGGTGLGLPISKQLAQLLGGDLTASSIEGEGSIFTLTLPLRYGQDNLA